MNAPAADVWCSTRRWMDSGCARVAGLKWMKNRKTKTNLPERLSRKHRSPFCGPSAARPSPEPPTPESVQSSPARAQFPNATRSEKAIAQVDFPSALRELDILPRCRSNKITMNVKEICRNCKHQRPAANEPRNHRHCLVWNWMTFVSETCQHFERAEKLRRAKLPPPF